MKNLKRRFLSIIMAAAMVLSFSTVVSATEIQANDSIVALQGDSSVASTYSLSAITDVVEYPNISSGTVLTGDFFQQPAQGSYITIVICSDSSCTVAVNGTSKYIPSGGGKYTICTATFRNTGYTIRFHENATAAVFQFFSTDYYYDG